jgi:hypothetical protein
METDSGTASCLKLDGRTDGPRDYMIIEKKHSSILTGRIVYEDNIDNTMNVSVLYD